MSNNNRLAISCPNDGLFGWIDLDYGRILLHSESEMANAILSLSHFLCRFPAHQIQECKNDDELRSFYQESKARADSYNACLVVFDLTLPSQLRSRAMLILEKIIDRQGVYEYLINILLVAPLKNQLDLTELQSLAQLSTKLTKLFTDVIFAQPRVKDFSRSLRAASENKLFEQVGIERFVGAILSARQVSSLVNAKSQDELKRISGALGVRLSTAYGIDARASGCFMQFFKKGLPEFLEEGVEGLDIHSVSERRNGESQVKRKNEKVIILSHRKDLPHVQLEQAIAQVERIAAEYTRGNDSVADKYLAELIDSQTADTYDHHHIVKSLCHIAKKCNMAGRKDVALQVLVRAMDFPAGIDAKLYMQMGTLLRQVREYDKALVCFHRAREHADPREKHKIALEIVRVASAQGHYGDAIREMTAICKTSAATPESLASLGTLYRKVGDFSAAWECYNKTVSDDHLFHRGWAGLAEIYKQKGDLHRAIRQYNILLRSPDEYSIDATSLKIYKLARCHLLRLDPKQIKTAVAQLRELLVAYPTDCDIHFSIAKALALVGDSIGAKYHFVKSQESGDIEQFATELFSKVMKLSTQDNNFKVGFIETSVFDPSLCLPERRGLAFCSQAFGNLNINNPEAALSNLSNAHYVDYLHRDFGLVLQYHAKKMIDSTVDYRIYPSVCRIAKRGHRTLRSAIRSIVDGNFVEAFRLEERMFLMVA